MWTEDGWRAMQPEVRPRWRAQRRGALALALAVVLLAGCGGEAGPPDPADERVVESGAPAAPAPSVQAEPATVADIFPEGPGRQLVLTNCASCHAVACTAIGQRPPGRWDELREAHREHVPSLSEEDLNTTFAYLRSNFSDAQPEPMVPPRFLEAGCTPF